MDPYLRRVCRAAHICQGGFHCGRDRPNPTSSAGARRKAAVKRLSYRTARSRLRVDTRRETLAAIRERGS